MKIGWLESTGLTPSDTHSSIGGRLYGTSKDHQEEAEAEETDLYRGNQTFILVQVDYNESRYRDCWIRPYG